MNNVYFQFDRCVDYYIRQSEIDFHRDVVGDYAERNVFIYETLRTTWGGCVVMVN
jgi:hypothetical protein